MTITTPSADYYRLGDFSFTGFSGKRYVAFDFEATGPNPTSDSITQIGAIIVCDSGIHDHEFFASYVRPRKPIPEKIEALTGVTNALVADAPHFSEAYARFQEFCSDAVLVTQCGYEFDFPLLDQECDLHQIPRQQNLRLDTKAIFALLHPEQTQIFSTNFLSDYYAIDRSLFKRHDALGDARLIAQLFFAEMAEARHMKIDSIAAEQPIEIKRFILPPL